MRSLRAAVSYVGAMRCGTATMLSAAVNVSNPSGCSSHSAACGALPGFASRRPLRLGATRHGSPSPPLRMAAMNRPSPRVSPGRNLYTGPVTAGDSEPLIAQSASVQTGSSSAPSSEQIHATFSSFSRALNVHVE